MDFARLFFHKIALFLNSTETLSLAVNNRFLLIFLVIVLLKMKYATYSSIWLSALINIPGTILHESMHFIVGLALNAYPTTFDLIPHKDGFGNYVMGSVGFRNVTFYNALPAALAPLFLLPIGFYFNRWYFNNIDITLGNYLLYILLQTVIIENAVPSATDFKVGFSYPAGILLYSAVFVSAVIFI